MDIDQTIATYPHTLPPFPQQIEALRRSLSKRRFALLMDQGTGKTKVIIDTCGMLFLRKQLDALLVVAPNDVHAQWVDEQIPEHLPKSIQRRCAVWRSSNARAFRECWELIKKPLPNRLIVLSMNHEAFSTAPGTKIAKAFLKQYRALLAIDESDLAIKTPNASRTKALVHYVGPFAHMRRILTGTPAADPFELYSQFKFLDDRILYYDSMLAFKHRYALWDKNTVLGPPSKGDGVRRLQTFETLVEYQNLDELNARTAPFIYRVRKEDCMNLPPKLYSKRRTHLSKAQKAIYDELKETGIALIKEQEANEKFQPLDLDKLADLEEDDLLMRMQDPQYKTTAALKITLLLRLHQIVGGFLTDDAGTVSAIDGDIANTPRIKDTLALIDNAMKGQAKCIVWCVYRAEIAALHTLFNAKYSKAQTPIKGVTMYGGMTPKAKTAAIADFKDPKSNVRITFAHQRSVGTGQNFQVATTCIYYSCNASSRDRIQSEDRAHRIGQKGTVNIYDLDAPEVPIDQTLRSIREKKQSFNSMVMGWGSTKLESMI